MKKLLSIAALLLAFSPFAQAQNGSLSGHPDARNDRNAVSSYSEHAVHKNHMGAKSRHHVKRHHPRHHYSKHMHRVVPVK